MNTKIARVFRKLLKFYKIQTQGIRKRVTFWFKNMTVWFAVI